VFDVDGLEFVGNAEFCLEFVDVLDFDANFTVLQGEAVVIGINGKVKSCLHMLQVNFFLILDKESEIMIEAISHNSPKTRDQVPPSSILLRIIVNIAVAQFEILTVDLNCNAIGFLPLGNFIDAAMLIDSNILPLAFDFS
jgi:hypothetical protein